MESTYGIGVKNRYELFYDDEEDPLDIIKQQEDEKKKKKETKQQQEKENKLKGPGPAPSKAKSIVPTKKGPKESPPVKAQEPPAPRKDGDNNRARSQKVSSDRMVKFSSNIREENKDLEERKNRRNREDNRPERGPPSGEFRERGGFDRSAQWDGGERNERGSGGNDRERGEREPREPRSGDAGEPRRGRGGFGMRGGGGGGGGGFRGRGRGGRGGSGGPGGAGGGGGGGGYDNRGKREFERQSGSDKSGVKAVEKRDGGGSHNWGTIRDDMDNMNNTAALSSDEAPEWAEKPEESTEVQSEKEGEQPPVTSADGEATDKPLVEEGPKIMTLDEWKKEQEKKRAVPQFNIRKAGEGEDSSQWKKTYVLKKKDVEEDAEEMEEEDEEDVARRGRAKHVVDIEINYSDSRRGRGRGRGGRGGSGPRGGGGSRGGFSRGSDPAGGGPGVGSVANSVGAVGGERLGGGVGGSSGGGGGGGGSGSSGVSRESSRGGGGRGGGGRGGHKNQSAPKVDDENDFPSLVAA